MKQDSKKGKPRLYGLETKFNYGCFPQTWENPWRHSKRIAAVGDGDPLDAVELGWLGGGAGPLPIGAVASVRVLGCLALIDEGEVDWKVHRTCAFNVCPHSAIRSSSPVLSTHWRCCAARLTYNRSPSAVQ